MNIQRLQRLIEILKTVPDNKFNINAWQSECGTVACAIGWALLDKDFNDQGFVYNSRNPHDLAAPSIVGKDLSAIESICYFFDIDKKTARNIFYSSGYMHSNPSVRQVIMKLENLIKKQAVCVYAMDSSGKILTVSRKTDPNDIGLPGGKVDLGEPFVDAAIRETLEETGYDISKTICPTPIHVGMCGEYKTHTYFALLTREVLTNRQHVDDHETGVVAIQDPWNILYGSFAEYNKQVLMKM